LVDYIPLFQFAAQSVPTAASFLPLPFDGVLLLLLDKISPRSERDSQVKAITDWCFNDTVLRDRMVGQYQLKFREQSPKRMKFFRNNFLFYFHKTTQISNYSIFFYFTKEINKFLTSFAGNMPGNGAPSDWQQKKR
jgi:hypothetical protein